MRFSPLTRRGVFTLLLTTLFLWSGVAASLRLGQTAPLTAQSQSPAQDEENEEEGRSSETHGKTLRLAARAAASVPRPTRETRHQWAVRTHHRADHAHAPRPLDNRPNLPRRLI